MKLLTCLPVRGMMRNKIYCLSVLFMAIIYLVLSVRFAFKEPLFWVMAGVSTLLIIGCIIDLIVHRDKTKK